MIRQTAYKDFSEGAIGLKESLSNIQTTNNTITTLDTISLPADARGYLLVTVLAAELTGSTYGIIGRKIIHWKTSGGVSTVVSSTNIIADSLDGLTTATWSVDANSGSLRIRVTGENSRTIDWYALHDNNYLTITPP